MSKEYKSEVYFSDQITEAFSFSIDNASLATKLVDQLEEAYVKVSDKVLEWEANGVVNIMSSVKLAGYKEHFNIGIDLTGTKPWSEEKISEYHKQKQVSKEKTEELNEFLLLDKIDQDDELEQLKKLVEAHPDSTVKFLLGSLANKMSKNDKDIK